MKNILIVFIVLNFGIYGRAQTFSNSVSGPISGSSTSCFDITVSGVGIIDAVTGLTEVCLDMDFSGPANAIITLVAPDGTILYLSYENGDFGSNFGEACFSMSASNSIRTNPNPYSGSYLPEMDLGLLNNGTINADGTWQICIENGWSWSETFNDASITFGSNPPQACGAQAGDDCSTAPSICDLNGYCGTTLPTYSATPVTTGCGYSINNNSFIAFTASATTVDIESTIENCSGSNGVQFEVFSGTSCSSLTSIDCGPSNPMPEGTQNLTFSGLVPGQNYYLMVDGYAGDVCSYSFTATSGIAVVDIIQGDNLSVCEETPLNLSVQQQAGVTYTWTWSGGSGGPLTGSTITIPSPVPTTNVIVTASGACQNATDQININSSPCCSANGGIWD